MFYYEIKNASGEILEASVTDHTCFYVFLERIKKRARIVGGGEKCIVYYEYVRSGVISDGFIEL